MFRLVRRVSATVCFAALAATGVAHAQGTAWQTFVSVTPIYEGKGDLDGGGDFNAWGAIVRAGVSGDIGGGNRAGLTFNYDYFDFSFSNPTAFGGVAPWGVVRRYGVAAPLFFAVPDAWIVSVVPTIDVFRENGADESEALNWGGIISASRVFAGGNRLGFGLGVFERIEKTSVFPLLLVDWKLTDRWRVMNPLQAGPTGPAGLELDYRFDNGWNLGLGAAWRTTRFRLSENGPVPDGIGEERGLPVFLRATRHFGGGMSLVFYAGVIANGQLRVEDAQGNELREVDFDPAPLLAVSFSARF